MKKNQIDVVSLGCSKNLVDSETLMKLFETNGYKCVADSKNPQGEIAVINTCGFIETAKEESINTILEFVERKNEGKLKKLFVMGCLSQRYQKELDKELKHTLNMRREELMRIFPKKEDLDRILRSM